jgi:hypothetical protein
MLLCENNMNERFLLFAQVIIGKSKITKNID